MLLPIGHGVLLRGRLKLSGQAIALRKKIREMIVMRTCCPYADSSVNYFPCATHWDESLCDFACQFCLPCFC